MAKLTRVKQKIFGINSGANDVAEFGSVAAGSPVYTKDPATIQSLAAFELGWQAATVANNAPTIEEMNAIQLLYARQLAYLFERGVPEWESTTTYYIGSLVTAADGTIYKSLTDDNTGNAITDGVNWAVGGGGSGAGDADSIQLIRAADMQGISLMTVSGNNSAFDGGGTITSDWAFSTAANDLLLSTAPSPRVLKYAPGVNGQNDYKGFEVKIPQAYKGKTIGLNFIFRNGSVAANGDFRFCTKIMDGASAGTIQYEDMDAYIAIAYEGMAYQTSLDIPYDCTTIRIGWQNKVTTTTVQLIVDNILVTANPFKYKAITNTSAWVNSGTVVFGSTGATPPTKGTTSCDKVWWRREGSECVLRYEYQQNGAGAAGSNSDYLITLPSGLVVDTSKVTAYTTEELQTHWNPVNNIGQGSFFTGAASYTGVACLYDSTRFRIMATGTAVCTFGYGNASLNIAGSGFSAMIKVPIVGWQDTSDHIVVPFKSNASDPVAYTPTFTGFGTPTNVHFTWAREGNCVLIRGRLTAGTTTAVEAQITLPTGLTSISDIATLEVCGSGAINAAGGGPVFTLMEASKTYFTLGYANLSTTTPLGKINGNALISSGNTLSVVARIPIQGWTSEGKWLGATPKTQCTYLKDVKAYNVDGGTAISAGHQVRTLNTLEGDSQYVFLNTSNSQFTIQNGKYKIRARAAAYHSAAVRTFVYLRDVSAGTNDAYDGKVGQSYLASALEIWPEVVLDINITTPKTFELKQYTSGYMAGDGLGVAHDVSGYNNIYAVVEILKIA